jgi:oxaloacetate decarboxylase alpha subunit
MFSNLLEQLREQRALDKLNQVLEEVPKVRKELGYPPLVTPTSQLVGIQAVFNVICGKRYGIVPKEIKDYVRGLYGKPPGPIDPKIRKKIIGDEQPIKGRPADLLEPGLNKVPEEVKPYIESEEDRITYALFPQTALEFFKKRGAKRQEAKTEVEAEKAVELEQVAAISVAVRAFQTSSGSLKALTLVRNRGSMANWVLAGRQSLSKPGG